MADRRPREHRVRVQTLDYSSVEAILRSFEEQYGMSSEEFLALYMAGKYERNHAAARWAGYARLAGELRPQVYDLVKPSGSDLVPA